MYFQQFYLTPFARVVYARVGGRGLRVDPQRDVAIYQEEDSGCGASRSVTSLKLICMRILSAAT